MAWVCPSCGFDDNQDSSARCLCGYEISMGEEGKYSKGDAISDTKPESASHRFWEHFVVGFLVCFFVGFMSSLFVSSWLALLIGFIICLFVGFLAGLYGEKVIKFLFELIRWMW
jgi:hypothetical protein